MSDSGFKSIYSVLIFIIAFSIINFYAKKVKEEKRFKLEYAKLKEMKIVEEGKNLTGQKSAFWQNISTCNESDRYSCNKLEVFVLDYKEPEKCLHENEL